jgi:hypothetical protein
MEQYDDGETELALTLNAMQRDLEQELDSLGGMVGRFRTIDAPEAEDLARNTMRAYDAIADVIRMVRTVRGIDPADRSAPAAGAKVAQAGIVYEASASEFFAEDGPGAVD